LKSVDEDDSEENEGPQTSPLPPGWCDNGGSHV